jgi:hypothetical protein
MATTETYYTALQKKVETGPRGFPGPTGGGGAMTGAQILAALLEVDGSGSNLDACKLDGQHGSYYAPLASPQFTGSIKVTDGTSPDFTQERTGTYSSKFRHIVGYSTEGDYAIVDDKDSSALRFRIDTDGDIIIPGILMIGTA